MWRGARRGFRVLSDGGQRHRRRACGWRQPLSRGGTWRNGDRPYADSARGRSVGALADPGIAGFRVGDRSGDPGGGAPRAEVAPRPVSVLRPRAAGLGPLACGARRRPGGPPHPFRSRRSLRPRFFACAALGASADSCARRRTFPAWGTPASGDRRAVGSADDGRFSRDMAPAPRRAGRIGGSRGRPAARGRPPRGRRSPSASSSASPRRMTVPPAKGRELGRLRKDLGGLPAEPPSAAAAASTQTWRRRHLFLERE